MKIKRDTGFSIDKLVKFKMDALKFKMDELNKSEEKYFTNLSFRNIFLHSK
ncbi:MAG: hypothetical protein GX383_10825 [Clostridium sp.]|nr:hypothetical protein [Clostridium sp.]